MLDHYQVEKDKWNEKALSTLQDQAALPKVRDYDATFFSRLALRPIHPFFNFDKNSRERAFLLDYGCGNGWASLILYSQVFRVVAFDIALNRLRVLKKVVEKEKIFNTQPSVANGEALPYGDASFDYVFGSAVLHHLDLDQALAEIARVLKPGGKAAFCEPFAHNPILNGIRYFKHHFLEDHLGTDRPLHYQDSEIFQRYFSQVQFIETSFFRDRCAILQPVESFLLKIKIFKRFASYFTILVVK